MKSVAHTLLWLTSNVAVTLVSLATLSAVSWGQSPELRNDPSWYDAGSIPLSAFSHTSSPAPAAYSPSTVTPTATGEWSQSDWQEGQQSAPTAPQPVSTEIAHGYRYRGEGKRGDNHSVALPQQETSLFDADPAAARWYGEMSATPYRFRNDARLDSITPTQPLPGYRFRPQ